MAKQVLKRESVKSISEMNALYNHVYRIGNVPNVDKERTAQNEELLPIDPGETYESFFNKKIANLDYYKNGKHHIRKNGVLGISLVLSYGKDDDMSLPDDFSFERWKKLSVEWLIKTFGRDNIASAVTNMDEMRLIGKTEKRTNPHIHALIIPIVNGKLCSTALTPTREAMRQMHDSYNEYMQQIGLERGAKYKLIQSDHIQKRYSMIEETLSKDLPNEKTLEFKEGVNKIIEEMNNGLIDADKAIEKIDELADVLYQQQNDFFHNQNLIDLNTRTDVKDMRKNIKALEKANKTLSERNTYLFNENKKIRDELTEFKEKVRTDLEKEYNKKYIILFKEIGSIENAKHAINYRDRIQKGIEYLEESEPETAKYIRKSISQVSQIYDRRQIQEKIQEKQLAE